MSVYAAVTATFINAVNRPSGKIYASGGTYNFTGSLSNAGNVTAAAATVRVDSFINEVGGLIHLRAGTSVDAVVTRLFASVLMCSVAALPDMSIHSPRKN